MQSQPHFFSFFQQVNPIYMTAHIDLHAFSLLALTLTLLFLSFIAPEFDTTKPIRLCGDFNAKWTVVIEAKYSWNTSNVDVVFFK